MQLRAVAGLGGEGAEEQQDLDTVARDVSEHLRSRSTHHRVFYGYSPGVIRTLSHMHSAARKSATQSYGVRTSDLARRHVGHLLRGVFGAEKVEEMFASVEEIESLENPEPAHKNQNQQQKSTAFDTEKDAEEMKRRGVPQSVIASGVKGDEVVSASLGFLLGLGEEEAAAATSAVPESGSLMSPLTPFNDNDDDDRPRLSAAQEAALLAEDDDAEFEEEIGRVRDVMKKTTHADPPEIRAAQAALRKAVEEREAEEHQQQLEQKKEQRAAEWEQKLNEERERREHPRRDPKRKRPVLSGLPDPSILLELIVAEHAEMREVEDSKYSARFKEMLRGVEDGDFARANAALPMTNNNNIKSGGGGNKSTAAFDINEGFIEHFHHKLQWALREVFDVQKQSDILSSQYNYLVLESAKRLAALEQAMDALADEKKAHRLTVEELERERERAMILFDQKQQQQQEAQQGGGDDEDEVKLLTMQSPLRHKTPSPTRSRGDIFDAEQQRHLPSQQQQQQASSSFSRRGRFSSLPHKHHHGYIGSDKLLHEQQLKQQRLAQQQEDEARRRRQLEQQQQQEQEEQEAADDDDGGEKLEQPPRRHGSPTDDVDWEGQSARGRPPQQQQKKQQQTPKTPSTNALHLTFEIAHIKKENESLKQQLEQLTAERANQADAHFSSLISERDSLQRALDFAKEELSIAQRVKGSASDEMQALSALLQSVRKEFGRVVDVVVTDKEKHWKDFLTVTAPFGSVQAEVMSLLQIPPSFSSSSNNNNNSSGGFTDGSLHLLGQLSEPWAQLSDNWKHKYRPSFTRPPSDDLLGKSDPHEQLSSMHLVNLGMNTLSQLKQLHGELVSATNDTTRRQQEAARVLQEQRRELRKGIRHKQKEEEAKVKALAERVEKERKKFLTLQEEVGIGGGNATPAVSATPAMSSSRDSTVATAPTVSRPNSASYSQTQLVLQQQHHQPQQHHRRESSTSFGLSVSEAPSMAAGAAGHSVSQTCSRQPTPTHSRPSSSGSRQQQPAQHQQQHAAPVEVFDAWVQTSPSLLPLQLPPGSPSSPPSRRVSRPPSASSSAAAAKPVATATTTAASSSSSKPPSRPTSAAGVTTIASVSSPVAASEGSDVAAGSSSSPIADAHPQETAVFVPQQQQQQDGESQDDKNSSSSNNNNGEEVASPAGSPSSAHSSPASSSHSAAAGRDNDDNNSNAGSDHDHQQQDQPSGTAVDEQQPDQQQQQQQPPCPVAVVETSDATFQTDPPELVKVPFQYQRVHQTLEDLSLNVEQLLPNFVALRLHDEMLDYLENEDLCAAGVDLVAHRRAIFCAIGKNPDLIKVVEEKKPEAEEILATSPTPQQSSASSPAAGAAADESSGGGNWWEKKGSGSGGEGVSTAMQTEAIPKVVTRPNFCQTDPPEIDLLSGSIASRHTGAAIPPPATPPAKTSGGSSWDPNALSKTPPPAGPFPAPKPAAATTTAAAAHSSSASSPSPSLAASNNQLSRPAPLDADTLMSSNSRPSGSASALAASSSMAPKPKPKAKGKSSSSTTGGGGLNRASSMRRKNKGDGKEVVAGGGGGASPGHMDLDGSIEYVSMAEHEVVKRKLEAALLNITDGRNRLAASDSELREANSKNKMTADQLRATQEKLIETQRARDVELVAARENSVELTNVKERIAQLEKKLILAEEKRMQESLQSVEDLKRVQDQLEAALHSDVVDKLKAKEKLFLGGSQATIQALKSLSTTLCCPCCYAPIRDAVIHIPCGHVLCRRCVTQFHEEEVGCTIRLDPITNVFSVSGVSYNKKPQHLLLAGTPKRTQKQHVVALLPSREYMLDAGSPISPKKAAAHGGGGGGDESASASSPQSMALASEASIAAASAATSTQHIKNLKMQCAECAHNAECDSGGGISTSISISGYNDPAALQTTVLRFSLMDAVVGAFEFAMKNAQTSRRSVIRDMMIVEAREDGEDDSDVKADAKKMEKIEQQADEHVEDLELSASQVVVKPVSGSKVHPSALKGRLVPLVQGVELDEEDELLGGQRGGAAPSAAPAGGGGSASAASFLRADDDDETSKLAEAADKWAA